MKDLISAYHEGNVILFVGAGISKNLGLPTWSELVDHIARELGYHPEIYNTFGESLALAEFYKIQKGDLNELLNWMNTAWHSDDARKLLPESEIHELIATSGFPIVYTTNYDRWLEEAFDFHNIKYTPIINVSDITEIKDDVTQIVKFHGDFEFKDTIVLGESSYYDRLELETPLDIKLRADVLGKSVLFIGYSLSDVNLRFLFHKLAHLWKSDPNSNVQPRSYIFSHRPNPVQQAILNQWNIEMITSDEDIPKTALIKFLKELGKTVQQPD